VKKSPDRATKNSKTFPNNQAKNKGLFINEGLEGEVDKQSK